MELEKAKEIVRTLEGTSIGQMGRSEYASTEIAEAIRLVSANSLQDQESKKVQNLVPKDMEFMGLYPHIMKTYDTPAVIFTPELKEEGRIDEFPTPTSTPVSIPNNLDEAVDTLVKVLSPELLVIRKQNEESFMAEAHHGLGRFLRNEWGLWSGSPIQSWFIEKGIHHADDMSGIILTCFHRKLNNKDFDLDKQIQHYINYWKIQDNLNNNT